MSETDKLVREIHACIVQGSPSSPKLLRLARNVVWARYYDGDDAWDRLKHAIGELEGLVGRPQKEEYEPCGIGAERSA